MNAKGIVFATSLLSMGSLALPSGCSSSSSSGSQADAASTDDSGDDGATSNSCSPVGGPMCPAGMGLTCCVNASGLGGLAGGGGGAGGGLGNIGSCVAPSSCSSMIQYQCMVPTDCASGQACCGGVGGDAGALLAALADAGDASFDAASLAADGGAGGLGGLGGALAGLSIESFCQASCMASQQQLCSSDADCKNAGTNSVCGPASLAALGGGAGGIGSLLGGFIMIKTCQPPEGGMGEGGTGTEAGGGSDSGGGSNDGSATDAGSSDAGASDGGAG